MSRIARLLGLGALAWAAWAVWHHRRHSHDIVGSRARLGRNVTIHPFTNLYGCTIGDETRVGPFVEVQKGVVIGSRCKISSHTFVCEGVHIADGVFVGHGVMFINDLDGA